jgi:hypothetical protein
VLRGRNYETYTKKKKQAPNWQVKEIIKIRAEMETKKNYTKNQ